MSLTETIIPYIIYLVLSHQIFHFHFCTIFLIYIFLFVKQCLAIVCLFLHII
ncbi:hypothetical protein Hdeb2414_s0088g00786421 [Helianthus debilis subsp. tardiflorus]